MMICELETMRMMIETLKFLVPKVEIDDDVST